MESMSRSERAALCNTALEAGEQAPTLCGLWTVKDLVIHLLVRERDPLGAPGILLPQLEGLTDRAARRLAGQDFSSLVERVRSGPPRWSPMSLPPLDRALNTLEFFVHHEDIRRAGTEWEPRELTDREQKVIWKAIGTAGKGLVRSIGVPVEIRWTSAERESSAVLRKGDDPVVVSGTPAEITMMLFGREQHVGLEFDGPEASVKKLTATDLGL
ncbi:MAG: TIGR03085 family metal-binding protein [Marmoricola sp.]